MRLYLEVSEKKSKVIENYSPYEIRQILIKVLTVRDWATAEKYKKNFFYYYYAIIIF